MTGAPASPDGGAEDILGQLAREHRPALLRYFARKGLAVADCEDGVQEVLLRLAKRADVLNEIDSLQGYLFTTASNVAADFFRNAVRRRFSLHDEYEDARHSRLVDGPDELFQSQEDLATLFLAMKELPEKTRTIFVLVRLEQMSQVEVARRLAVSLSTVEKHVAKAASYLSQRIERR